MCWVSPTKLIMGGCWLCTALLKEKRKQLEKLSGFILCLCLTWKSFVSIENNFSLPVFLSRLSVVFKEPPYKVMELGSEGFLMRIEVHLKNKVKLIYKSVKKFKKMHKIQKSLFIKLLRSVIMPFHQLQFLPSLQLNCFRWDNYFMSVLLT